MLSKRKLLQLVEEGIVQAGTIRACRRSAAFAGAGTRRRRSAAFCKHIGVNKFNSTVEISVLENFLRDDLNKRRSASMGVLRPLKVVITNYPEGQAEELDAVNNPEDPSAGTRKVPFSRVLYIEQDDFIEVPPPKYFRLFPGHRSSAALRVLRPLHGRREGRRRQRDRSPLHLRPGHQGRRLAGQAQGESDDPLGVGEARGRRRGAAVRPPLHSRRSGRRARWKRLAGQSQSQFARSA